MEACKRTPTSASERCRCAAEGRQLVHRSSGPRPRHRAGRHERRVDEEGRGWHLAGARYSRGKQVQVAVDYKGNVVTSPNSKRTRKRTTIMRTISRAYDSYAQARSAVEAIEKAESRVPMSASFANKYVSAEHADVDDVQRRCRGRRHWRRAGRRRRPAGRPRIARHSWPRSRRGGRLARLGCGSGRGGAGCWRPRRRSGRRRNETASTLMSMPSRCAAAARWSPRAYPTRTPRGPRRSWISTVLSIRWRVVPNIAKVGGAPSTRRRHPTDPARPRLIACDPGGRADRRLTSNRKRRGRKARPFGPTIRECRLPTPLF